MFKIDSMTQYLSDFVIKFDFTQLKIDIQVCKNQCRHKTYFEPIHHI